VAPAGACAIGLLNRDVARVEVAVEQGCSGESGSHPTCRRTSVRAHMPLIHAPVRPWSPPSPRRRRGPKSARTSALRVPAATSDAGLRGRRSTRRVAEHLEDWLENRKRLRCFLADRPSAVAALTRIFIS
jgi:hypothetical protein